MSLFIGNPDYSPVKGYGQLQGDFSTINSTIDITEGKLIKLDDGIAFCLIAKAITDLYKADSFVENTPVCLVLHEKEYTRWTKDNPKTVTQPTDIELALIEYFDNQGKQWLDCNFSGSLQLMNLKDVIADVKKGNLWHIFVKFAQCEPSSIKDVEVKSGFSGNGKRGNYGQSTAQQLTDKQSFLIAASGTYGEGVKNLMELALGLNDFRKEMPEVYQIWSELVKTTLTSK